MMMVFLFSYNNCKHNNNIQSSDQIILQLNFIRCSKFVHPKQQYTYSQPNMLHSQYRTPKRRHSSLFQRMEQQIQKISRKLSFVKSSARQYSADKPRAVKCLGRKEQKGKRGDQRKERVKENQFETSSHFKNIRKNIHFEQFPQGSVIQTVRIKRMPQQKPYLLSPLSINKTLTSKTLNKRLNFASFRQNQQQRIIKLQQQNQELSIQLKNLQAVCADQSYRMGYASAYFDDKCRKLEEEKDDLQRQNVYLQKLCEHYKSKSKKYKDALNKYSSSNRHISEESNYSCC